MMYFVASVLVTTLLSPVAATSLRGYSRRTQQEGFRDFVPLSCNSKLASVSCTPWSTYVGAKDSHNDLVVIDCGDCVTMDHAGETLSLLKGLDIRGKLIFPDNYKLSIEASMILVQGELEMTASKPVDGEPNIKITMIGDDDLSFEPHDVNAGACSGRPCAIGKKGIIVAGGKVNTAGIPSGTPTWVRLYDVKSDNTIVVENTVATKWVVGAEILITSHTRVWNQHQVRRIATVRNSVESGYVELELDGSIIRPTTLKDNQDYAVEVALLSRNILFLGGIMHTPKVVQTVEGIEFRNFGQQGNLGRYPIHFHFLDDASGSIISKNTIRECNQRCVVVHGTNYLEIKDNVAFDTAGHCFLTEDGIERGNRFIRNLGAQTKVPQIIIPDLGLNGKETDGEPATFWITAATNSYEGNVAAGSESSGYWFEPVLRGERAHWFPNLEPQKEPLTLFKDNVAHSTVGKTGAVRMYKPGYFPTETAFLDGMKVYRNNASGIFIHRCHNIVVRNSLFADNNIGVDIDRAEGIKVQDTVIIGESESYRELMARQDVEAVCQTQNQKLTGVDLHTWKKEKEYAGALMTNVNFSGFSNTACQDPASIRFDKHTLKQGIFEFYTEMVRTTLQDGPESIDFCLVEEEDEFDMVFIVDADGSLNPSTITTQGPSTLVSNSQQLMEFVKNPSHCTDVPNGCYKYCANICFRSVRYEVENGDNYMLKVCSPYDHSSCVMFPGGRRGDIGPHTFLAHLPVGQTYQAVLVDNRGQEVAGATVLEEYEESYCSSDDSFEVTLYDSLPPEIVRAPTDAPTVAPTMSPTFAPTISPTVRPTVPPTGNPTVSPTTAKPTRNSTSAPSSTISRPTIASASSETDSTAPSSPTESPTIVKSDPATFDPPSVGASEPTAPPESSTAAPSTKEATTEGSNITPIVVVGSLALGFVLFGIGVYVFRKQLHPRLRPPNDTGKNTRRQNLDESGLTNLEESELNS